jgi:phosphatidate cytidylyltransferase
VADRHDDEKGDRPPAEGVRIIGAEEAQAALETGQAAPRLGDDELRFGDVPPRAEAPPSAPSVRFPLPAESSPVLGGSPPVTPQPAAPEPGAGGPGTESLDLTDDASSGLQLPHWTEPATGEVPRSLGGDEPTDDPLLGAQDDEPDSWSRVGGGVRYRDTPSDWAGHDFSPGESLHDERSAVGALAERDDDDEDQTFDQEVAARRRGGRRGVGPGDGSGPSNGTGARGAVESTGRDLPTAITVGLAVGVGALVIFRLGRPWAAGLVAVIAALAAAELYAALRVRGYSPATLLGIVATAGVVLATYWKGERAFLVVTVLTSAFSLLWYLIGVSTARATVNAGLTMFGYGYIGVLAAFGGLLLRHPDGIGMLLGLAICGVGYDVGGYAVGSAVGRRRLAPSISPNKTWEGLAGGFAASVILGLFPVSVMAPWSVSHGVLLGAVIGVVAPFGDLCESLLKRDLGVKDLGGLLPGHGGILDRFDAILFVLPAVYYLVKVLELR